MADDPNADGTAQKPRKPAKWETLERIEVRVTEAQLDRISRLAKQRANANRADRRATTGGPKIRTERITTNTIIRIGMDAFLLLVQWLERQPGGWQGHTEAELRASAKNALKQLLGGGANSSPDEDDGENEHDGQQGPGQAWI